MMNKIEQSGLFLHSLNILRFDLVIILTLEFAMADKLIEDVQAIEKVINNIKFGKEFMSSKEYLISK